MTAANRPIKVFLVTLAGLGVVLIVFGMHVQRAAVAPQPLRADRARFPSSSGSPPSPAVLTDRMAGLCEVERFTGQPPPEVLATPVPQPIRLTLAKSALDRESGPFTYVLFVTPERRVMKVWPVVVPESVQLRDALALALQGWKAPAGLVGGGETLAPHSHCLVVTPEIDWQ